MTRPAAGPYRLLPAAAVALAALLAFGAMVWTAWVSDDAFITLRTVDNLLSGHGATWNPQHRVQSYTHPLWAIVLLAVQAMVREPWMTALVAGLATSAAALAALIATHRRTPAALTLALVALASSRAFIEYSTSGLENPLTHLLLVLTVWRWASPDRTPGRLLLLGLCAGLGATNRLDTVLLFGPLLGHAAWQHLQLGQRRVVGAALAAALAPVAAWELFSLVYYGYPFPNTAYAKLGTGIPRAELLRQGLIYQLELVLHDTPTVLLLAAGGFAWIYRLGRGAWPLLGGCLAYLGYLVWIGGDFMAGRFFTALACAAAVGVAGLPLQGPRVWALAPALLGILTLLGPTAPWRTGPAFGQGTVTRAPSGELRFTTFSGIGDERAIYFPATGLSNRRARRHPVEHLHVEDARAAVARGERVVVYDFVGFFGYYGGPGLHVVDRLGLTDPLLARLPVPRGRPWRVGHYRRDLPEGWVATLQSGQNRLTDPQVARRWTQIQPRVQGPLWAPERLAALLRFWRP